jgi:hypothetical protein
MRFAWAARATCIGAVSLLAAWFLDRGDVDARASLVAAVLAPYAVSLALGAAVAVAAFESDVRGRQLTWRQPAGVVVLAAAVVGLVPVVPAVGGGSWRAGGDELSVVLRLLPDPDGPARTLWVGPPEDLPAPGWPLAPGLAYALTGTGAPTFTDGWVDEATSAELRVLSALDDAVSARTDRLGRLLGPMGVQYVMVPVRDEADDGTASAEPSGPTLAPLLDALSRQLDLERLELGQDALEVYANVSAVPVRAALTGEAAEASRQGSADTLTQLDTSGGAPVLPGELPTEGAGPVAGEVVVVSQAADSGWRLTVDGAEVARRPAYGWANGWDLTGDGDGVLSFATPVARTVTVVAQALLWVLVLVVAALLRSVPARRRRPITPEGAVIDLGTDTGLGPLEGVEAWTPGSEASPATAPPLAGGPPGGGLPEESPPAAGGSPEEGPPAAGGSPEEGPPAAGGSPEEGQPAAGGPPA